MQLLAAVRLTFRSHGLCSMVQVCRMVPGRRLRPGSMPTGNAARTGPLSRSATLQPMASLPLQVCAASHTAVCLPEPSTWCTLNLSERNLISGAVSAMRVCAQLKVISHRGCRAFSVGGLRRRQVLSRAAQRQGTTVAAMAISWAHPILLMLTVCVSLRVSVRYREIQSSTHCNTT